MGHPVWERIAVLCEQLSGTPHLKRIIESGGGGADLAALFEALGGVTDPQPEAITELIDEIERVLRSVGLSGLSTRTFLNPASEFVLPPGMTAKPTTVGWTCPLGRCSRVVLSEETSKPPVCAASDGRMKPFEVFPR
ncbi:hypothetical protein [Streptacidiphilus fuscans]|uniref:Uncharacterized protein n=1 Tax=Streptacidiphilus fuscans TaxID=2789292 RepID=A0A931FGD3_9ACTN|nr:hypothetical protein [Streptacidiphilus fuscans]MBF9072513.1 hypothetical protein [Streptacidiphilus fuscans]